LPTGIFANDYSYYTLTKPNISNARSIAGKFANGYSYHNCKRLE